MKNWLWVLWIPLFLISLGLFYIEVTLVSLLPANQGGMTFWEEFKIVWYSSPIFFVNLILFISVIGFVIFKFKNKNEFSKKSIKLKV